MPHENLKPSDTMFGQKLQAAMDEKRMEIRDLSDAIGSTYEYVRKLVRGLALPSKYMLKILCDHLKLNFDEMATLVTSDHLNKKYGGIPLELAGKNPAVEPFERNWKHLNKDQRDILLTQLRTFVSNNRKHAREKA